jgi:hypothetical protein
MNKALFLMRMLAKRCLKFVGLHQKFHLIRRNLCRMMNTIQNIIIIIIYYSLLLELYIQLPSCWAISITHAAFKRRSGENHVIKYWLESKRHDARVTVFFTFPF